MLNAFRYLGKETQEQVDDMTLFEYQIQMKAYALRVLDREYAAHKQAWLNQQVQATKKQGKKTVPVYKKFTDFFDYKKQEEQILGKKERPKENKLVNLMLQANSGREEGTNGAVHS